MLKRIGSDHLEEDPLVACQPVAEDAVPFAVEHSYRPPRDAANGCGVNVSSASSTRISTRSTWSIERTDTWTVMSCKPFLAPLQLLVAQREAFLTRLGVVSDRNWLLQAMVQQEP